MKPLQLLVLFIFFSNNVISQNDWNRSDFFMNILPQCVTHKDLTDDVYQNLRKELKVKKITKTYLNPGQDTIFPKEIYIKMILKDKMLYHGFPRIEITNFDKNGILTFKAEYPYNNNFLVLSKEDSVSMQRYKVDCVTKNDTTTFEKKWYKGGFEPKKIYYKGRLEYEIRPKTIPISEKDSVNHQMSVRIEVVNNAFIKSDYFYDNKNRLVRISNLYDGDDYKQDVIKTIEYPSKKKIHETKIGKDLMSNDLYKFKNIIYKNKNGKIYKSKFYNYYNFSNDIYYVVYDKQGNITEFYDLEYWGKKDFGKNEYFKYENTYKNDKLISVKEIKDKGMDDVTFYIDERGLIIKEETNSNKILYEYEFYK